MPHKHFYRHVLHQWSSASSCHKSEDTARAHTDADARTNKKKKEELHLKTVLPHTSYLRYVSLVPFVFIFCNDDNFSLEEASDNASIVKFSFKNDLVLHLHRE